MTPNDKGTRRPGYERLLMLAEKIGSLASRIEAIERENATQRTAIDSSHRTQDGGAQALQAALRGIEALSCHILDGRVSELGQRLDSTAADLGNIGKKIGKIEEAAAGDVAALAEAKATTAQALEHATSELRRQIDAALAAIARVEAQAGEKLAETDRVHRELAAGHAKTLSEGFAGEISGLKTELEQVKTALVGEISATKKQLETLISWTPKGTYQPGTYARGDVVTLAGSSYVSLVDQNDERPGRKATKWQLLAASGAGSGIAGGGDSLPSQVGNNGKFLKTDGTTTSWATIAGGGDMLAENNLSDVEDAAEAFGNIKQAATETASGVVELATSAETTAGLAVQASDTRLSNARTPTNHDHSSNKLAQANTHESPDTDSATSALHHTLGTGANQACAGDDERLSDARTPTAHSTSHQDGGTDEISVDGLSGELADPQTPKDHASAHVTGGDDVIADAVAGGNSGLMSGTDKTKLDGITAGANVTTTNTVSLSNKTLTNPTLSGYQNFASLASDHTSVGPSCNFINAGATVAAFELVYLHTDGEWALADADAASTSGPVMLAVALEAGTDGNAMRVALSGSFIRDDTWNWTIGGALYVSTTGGAFTQTAPTGTDDVDRVVGWAVTADIIYFMPESAWGTHTG